MNSNADVVSNHRVLVDDAKISHLRAFGFAIERAGRLAGAFSLIGILALAENPARAHSSTDGFRSDHIAHESHTALQSDSRAQRRYPGVVAIDTRRIRSLVIKVNAKVVGLRSLYVGKKVSEHEVLAEMESAELLTVQSTYLGILNNIDAVQAASLTIPQKMIEARMTLQWRGMSKSEIDQLEATRHPIERIAIRSPAAGYIYSLGMINGQILNAGVQAGLFTAVGTTVASIAQPGAFLVEADVPVDEAMSLHPGDKATVLLPSANGGWKPVPASIQSAPGLPNSLTQRQIIRLILSDAPGNFAYVNGMQVTVAFEKEHHVKKNPTEY